MSYSLPSSEDEGAVPPAPQASVTAPEPVDTTSSSSENGGRNATSASGPETKEIGDRPGTAMSTSTASGAGIEVSVTLKMDPELGLGMALALSKPVAIAEKVGHRLAGKKLQVVDKVAIANDPDLKSLQKSSADQVLCTGVIEAPGSDPNDPVWDVTIDKTGDKKSFKLSQLRFPGIVFVNRFARRKNGTKGQAESDGDVCLRDQLIKVNGERGTDLKHFVQLIKQGGVADVTLTFLRTQTNENARLKRLEDDKQAEKIETCLRLIFSKIQGDGDETNFVTMEQLEAAGLAVYRDAAAIVLPNIPAKDFFKSLDENGDGKVTWTEFKDFLLVGSTMVSHGARMANYASIFEDVTGEVSESSKISVGALKVHVANENSLMNRIFPSIAHKIVAIFDELDTDHSGDLDWGEFRDGCEKFWAAKMHPETAAKLGSEKKVDFLTAKSLGEGLSAEDQVHPAVPEHLVEASQVAEINSTAGVPVNNDAVEAAKKAAILLERNKQEEELAAQARHVEELKKSEEALALQKKEDEAAAAKRRKEEVEKEAEPVAPAKGGGCCIVS